MRRTKTTENRKTRVTLDLSEDAYKRLEWLQEKTEAASKADVLRSALRLLEYVVRGGAERVCDLLPVAELDEPKQVLEDQQRKQRVVRLVAARQA